MVISVDEQISKFIIWTLYLVGLYFSLFWLSVLIFDNTKNSKKRRKVWPGVTIIIPMWNEEKYIEETLDSIYGLDYPKKKFNVICVDDGSTDGTLKILRKLNKKYNFKLIKKKNGGKVSAVNIGLEHVDTDFFSIFDADSYTEPQSLKALIEEFDSADVAATMPVMKIKNPRNTLEKVQWLEYMINIFYKYIMGKIDCIHVTPGPFSTFRTKIVRKLGGFRDAYMTEDLEMAFRLQDNHYRLKQSLEAVVYTSPPNNLKGFVSQRVRWYQGTIMNLKDYKHFILNKKYEEFGMFHIPLVAVTGFLLLAGVFVAIYLFLKNLFHTIKRWYLTNFDFYSYITNYRWNTTLLDLNWDVLFTSGVLLGIMFISIYLSFSTSKEKVSILRGVKYFVMFLYYFLIYRFILAWVWAKVSYRVIFRKKNRWDKVN